MFQCEYRVKITFLGVLLQAGEQVLVLRNPELAAGVAGAGRGAGRGTGRGAGLGSWALLWWLRRCSLRVTSGVLRLLSDHRLACTVRVLVCICASFVPHVLGKCIYMCVLPLSCLVVFGVVGTLLLEAGLTDSQVRTKGVLVFPSVGEVK